MINLSKILEEIKNDKKVSELSITEQMEYTTFRYLAEVIDINNTYPIKVNKGFFAEFEDDNNVTHFTRITYQPLKIPRNDVKIGFYDENGKPSYDRPNLHYNLHPDEKIFNTHLHILLEQFLDKEDFFKKTNATELYLPAIDYHRYRLFRMALNKLLDKSKYELFDDTKHPNTTIIKK